MLYPFSFNPILKERIWGGRRLGELYGKRVPGGAPIGESWEISDRPGDSSVITNGSLAGKDLGWLMQKCGEALLGRTPGAGERFPLLIKILDARQTLSLQVHPPASKAAELGGEPKTEMWYVAEADPGAELLVGLRRGVTRAEFEQRTEDGTVAQCFHKVPVAYGDSMFLPSGRVHALGAGLVIFEIQQNSDTTYRVFDWNRKGADGKPRELHISQSLASIDFLDFEPEITPPTWKSCSGWHVRELANDKLFSVRLIKGEGQRSGSPGGAQSMQLPIGTCTIVGVTSGTAAIEGGGVTVSLAAGGFCLVPAVVSARLMADKAELLLIQPGPAGFRPQD